MTAHQPHDRGQVVQWGRRFAILTGVLFIFRLVFVNALPLSGDEAYHWEWSRHLDWGFYDHPPLTAYLIRLSTLLLGTRFELGVRLPALVCLLGAAWCAFLLARTLARQADVSTNGAGRAGFAAGSMVLLFPLHAGLGLYMSTDPALVVTWSAGLLFLVRALSGKGRYRDWAFAGLAFGLAGMSKFLAIMIVPALAIFMVIEPNMRRWWRRPEPYLMGLIAAGCVAPFIVWNALNDWPTFRFNFVARNADALRWRVDYVLTYVASQLLVVLAPGFCLAFFPALHRGLGSQRKVANGALRFLALTWIVPAVMLLKTSLTRQVGLHWTAAYWVGGFVLLAVVATRALERGETGPVTWPARLSIPWRIAVIAFCLGHIVLLTPARLIEQVAARQTSVAFQSTLRKHSERFGLKAFGHWVDDGVARLAATRRGSADLVFVICPSYSLAATTTFYRPSKRSLHLWSGPCPYGESYRLWTDFQALKGHDALFVAKKARDADRYRESLVGHFETVGPVETLAIRQGQWTLRTFYRISCRNFDGRIPAFPKPDNATP